MLAITARGLALDVWDPSVPIWIAAAIGLYLVAKGWQELIPSRRDTASWGLGFHRRRFALRRLRRADQLRPGWRSPPQRPMAGRRRADVSACQRRDGIG